MKIMFAECCASLVVPNKEDGKPAECYCGKSYVWWEDGARGNLALWTNSDSRPTVLGIHNGLLQDDLDTFVCVTRDAMDGILADTPDNYLFKQVSSLIVRIEPGTTSDIRMVSAREADELGIVVFNKINSNQ